MLGCDDVARLVSDYQDRALPVRTRMAVAMHLAMCRTCRAMERSMRDTVDVLRGLRDLDPTEPVTTTDTTEG